MIKQTKFKTCAGTIILYSIQGIIKLIFPGYPLTEVMAGQGALAIAYTGLRLAQNKWSNNNEKP